VVTVDVTAARELVASAGHRYLDVRCMLDIQVQYSIGNTNSDCCD
jgi:hypothetical protein